MKNLSPDSEPDWMSVEAAARSVTMGKTAFYQNLISTGVIKSCVIKKPGNVKGLRRISRVSLNDYLNKLAEKEQGALAA